jgi:hypothetical protein
MVLQSWHACPQKPISWTLQSPQQSSPHAHSTYFAACILLNAAYLLRLRSVNGRWMKWVQNIGGKISTTEAHVKGRKKPVPMPLCLQISHKLDCPGMKTGTPWWTRLRFQFHIQHSTNTISHNVFVITLGKVVELLTEVPNEMVSQLAWLLRNQAESVPNADFLASSAYFPAQQFDVTVNAIIRSSQWWFQEEDANPTLWNSTAFSSLLGGPSSEENFLSRHGDKKSDETTKNPIKNCSPAHGTSLI